MKKGASGRLKEAINALCRVLCAPGGGPNPETFRQAKFNQAQVTAEFWKLICCLLKKIYVEEIGASVNDAEKIDDQVRFVKSVLWYHGYGVPEFYRLPEDGSEGSRELLLAFSWLLHKIHLLEKLLEVTKVSLGDEMSVCTCPGCLPTTPQQGMEAQPPKSEVDMRYLQSLNGKLQFQWRVLHAAQQEKCALLHKIHSYTGGCRSSSTFAHFSVAETDLIRHPEKCSELVRLVESENSRLVAYLDWKELEPVYWHWMETVLNSKFEDARTLQVQDDDNQNVGLAAIDGCPQIGDRLKDLEKLTKEFVEMHDGLQELVTCKRIAWNEKIKAKEKELLDEPQFLRTVKKIQQQVEKEVKDLKHNCTHETSKMHGSYRLVLKDAPCPVKKGSTGLGHQDPVTKTLLAREVITSLRTKGNRMEKELRQLQEECRSTLEAIAEGFDGVVCIPPPKR